MARLTIRIDLSEQGAIGPGKIRLLELVGESGSISAAGRAMKMSYRRAWMLVDELNRCFREPLRRALACRRAGGEPPPARPRSIHQNTSTALACTSLDRSSLYLFVHIAGGEATRGDRDIAQAFDVAIPGYGAM